MAVSGPMAGVAAAAGDRFVPRTHIHHLVLGIVWLMVASGAVVFSEPAPVDVLAMGLLIALPVVGLVRVNRGLLAILALLLVAAAGAALACLSAVDTAAAATHTAISLYLYLVAFVLAGFIAARPRAHGRLVLHAYLWAAFVGALAGIAGYFALIPGAEELFTRFARASGTFKDPNVYGAFLVPALIYALHLVVTRRLIAAVGPAVMAMFLTLAVLLSFSRGAWLNLAVASAAYLYLTFVTAGRDLERLKLVALSAVALLVVLAGLALAMQHPDIGELLNQRLTLTQSYDEGPEGRFGGQWKALGLIAEHPLGLGALEFGARHHAEDVHNVYLSMFLNAGWLGGFTHLALVAMTLTLGLDHALKRTPTRALFIVAFAALIGVAVEGMVIDTDHWRHLYLLLALVWGMMTAADARQPSRATAHRRSIAATGRRHW